MITALIALALVPPTSAAPDPAPAEVTVTAPAPEATPAEKLAAIQGLFDQSCGQRAYAAYDDLCENLARQIKDYRREQDRPAAPKRR